MSATAVKRPLAQALAEAEAFRDLFAGCYTRWEIAGSVRRRKAACGDVDHVVIGRITTIPDLFGGPGESACAVRELLASMLDRGALKLHVYSDGRHRYGDRLIGVDYRGLRHEVHFADEDNWGCALSIWTGSGDFSHALVARMRARGYRQHLGRLHRRNLDGQITSRFDTHIEGEWYQDIPCPDEETFFAAAGLDVAQWPPERREGTP